MSTESTTPLYALEHVDPRVPPEWLEVTYRWRPATGYREVRGAVTNGGLGVNSQTKWFRFDVSRNDALAILKCMVRDLEGFCEPF